MNFLKPHTYLEKIHETIDYRLSILLYVDDNLRHKDTIGPNYRIGNVDGPYPPETTETVIELIFEDSPGTKNPTPMNFNFVLEGSKVGPDIKVRVDAIHEHPFHTHNGTSSPHYGDPKN